MGTASLAFGLFIKITSELLEHEVSGVDRTILIGVAKARTPWLTVVAVDLTALGSVTVVVLISTIALCVLLLLKDRMGALQLVAAFVGAGILTTTIKNYIDRPRPEVVPQLIQVSGLSYPSGHSLAAASFYLTVAILVCRHLQRTGHQIAILAMTVGIILLVGISRIYLGVHYPSDVASGISLGAAWALLLAGCFSFFSDSKSVRREQ
ncbi:MAG: phosphatase PAP2 family protein [Candidatus Sulfotelmatobacter sp.]